MSVNKKNRSLWGSRSEAQRIYYQRQTIKRLEKENENLKEKCEKQQYTITENCDLRKQIDKLTQQRQELRSWLEEYKENASNSLDSYDCGIVDCLEDVLKKLNELEGKNERNTKTRNVS